MKNKIFLLFTIVFSFFATKGQTIQWPVNQSINSQGNIIGTVGEFRPPSITHPNGRFHMGTDITGNNTNIYAINAGTIIRVEDGNNSYLRINNVYYYHVRPTETISDILDVGQTVTVKIGDEIGSMLEQTNVHVHLENSTTNYKAQHLSPYIDNVSAAPYFSSNFINNGVQFYRNPILRSTPAANLPTLVLNQQVTAEGVQYTKLYSKIDIAVHAIEPRTLSNGASGGGQCAPNRISWVLRNANNQDLIVDNSFDFTSMPVNDANHINACFHPQSAGLSNPSINIITASPTQNTYDRYFNTGLRTNTTDTWPNNTTLDANCNQNAQYPDGKYTLIIRASDVSFNSNPQNTTPDADKTVNILIDNFRPYIQKVEIKSGAIDIYKGAWEWNSTNRALEYIPNSKSSTSNPQDGIINKAARNVYISVMVTASEPLRELKIIKIEATQQTEPLNINYPITGIPLDANGKEWVFTIETSAINQNGSNDGIHYIQFSGSDLGNNPLEGFSPSRTSYSGTDIPKHITENDWQPAPHNQQVYDNMHCFEIGGTGSGNTVNVIINANVAQTSINTPVTFSALIMGCNGNTPLKSSGVTNETSSSCSTDPADYSYKWVFKDGTNPPQTVTGSSLITKTFSSNSLITAEVTLLQNNTPVGYCLKKDIVNVGAVLQTNIISDKEFAMIDEPITVSASATGGYGNYVYKWSFSSDCSLNISADQATTISFSESGIKTITLMVTSGTVTKTTVKTVVISDNPPLTADFQNDFYNNNYTIPTNRIIYFLSFVQNAKGSVRYLWDFGDNSRTDLTNQSPNPSHTFEKAGLYNVSLTVMDDISTRIVTHTYQVTPLGTTVIDFTATPSPTDQSVKFDITSNKSTYVRFEYGNGGGLSNPILVNPQSPSTITMHYSWGGSKHVTLYALDNKTWVKVLEKDIVVNYNPLNPNVEVGFVHGYTNGDIVVKPYVIAEHRDIEQFANHVGVVSNSSPCTSEIGTPFYYKYLWKLVWGSENFGLSHTYERCSFITTEISKPKTIIISADVQGTIKTDPYVKTFSSDPRTIILHPPITTNLKKIYPICSGQTLQLIPEVKGGCPPYTYIWEREETRVSYNSSISIPVGDQPINYSLTIGDSRECLYGTDNFYKMYFRVQPTTLNVDAGNLIKLCNFDEIGTFNASVSGGSGKYSYVWEPFNNLSSTSILRPNVSTTEEGTKTYTLKVTDEYGCIATDQASVVAYKELQVVLEPIYYVKGNNSKLICPVVLNGSGNFSYEWSNGVKTKDVNVNHQSSRNLTLKVTDNITGCLKNASCTVLSLSSNITSKNNFIRSRNSNTTFITLTSAPGNISYSTHTDCSWLTVKNGITGFTGDKIELFISENDTDNERIGKLIIESPEALNSPYEITITQKVDKIIRVPSDFSTIQEAINAAPDGGKVEVDEGIYYENIVFSGAKKISVKASGCPENTTIWSGSINKPVVFFNANNSILQGFTITGSNNSHQDGQWSLHGGGIYSNSSSPELYDLIISNNYASYGGGIYIGDGYPTLINIKILNNTAVIGGGLYISNEPSAQYVKVLNSLITGNKAEAATPTYTGYLGTAGGLWCLGSTILDNVTISNNSYNCQSPQFKGSLYLNNLIMKNCIITDYINTQGGSLSINYSNINTTINGSITVSWDVGNINSNPMFDSNYGLSSGSPSINTGEPNKLDKDGSRCDMGYTGGKGIFNTTAMVCTKGNIFTSTPRILEIGANCSPLLSYGPGESEDFAATQQIALKSGFEGKTGSILSFKIKTNYNEPFQYDDRCVAFKIPEDPLRITHQDFNFNVYPNPTEGTFKLVLLHSNEDVCYAEVLNILGVTLKKGIVKNSISDFDISEFKPGSYLIKVTSGVNVKTKMIIKQ